MFEQGFAFSCELISDIYLNYIYVFYATRFRITSPQNWAFHENSLGQLSENDVQWCATKVRNSFKNIQEKAHFQISVAGSASSQAAKHAASNSDFYSQKKIAHNSRFSFFCGINCFHRSLLCTCHMMLHLCVGA